MALRLLLPGQQVAHPSIDLRSLPPYRLTQRTPTKDASTNLYHRRSEPVDQEGADSPVRTSAGPASGGRCAMASAPKMDSGSAGSSPDATSTGVRYSGSKSPAGRISSGTARPAARAPHAPATAAPRSTPDPPTSASCSDSERVRPHAFGCQDVARALHQ